MFCRRPFSEREIEEGISVKTSPLLLVRADASPAIGSGHVMRCLALAKAWQNVGGRVSWLMAENIASLDERLVDEGMDRRSLAAEPGTARDAAQTVAVARGTNPAWVVVDGYRFQPAYIRELESAGLRVLFMDDDGRFDSYVSDVVLNQNVSARPEMYEKRESFTRLLLGSEYVLLRPEFLAEPPVRDIRAIGKNLLVTMGGSDPQDVTRIVLLAMKQVESTFEAKVVIGGGNLRQNELETLVVELNPNVKLERSPKDMAPLMRWADVAISGAGGTCWELAYMGVPSIVIALSADQRGIAEGLAMRDIVVNLGWHATLTEERICDALLSLSNDHRRRSAMSERGRNLIDGRGAARVVEFLQNSL